MKKFYLVNVVNPSVPTSKPETFVAESIAEVTAYAESHEDAVLNVMTVKTLPL